MATDDLYDLIVFGSAIIGCSLALAVRRAGYRVLIIDKSVHPRFALGESLLTPTSAWMMRYAARWQVPELDIIVSAQRLCREVAPTSGVKRNFGFVYHREDAQAADEQWMVTIPSYHRPDIGECHLFRQDVDAALYHAAVAAGVDILAPVSTRGFDELQDTVIVKTDQGTVRARYAVDAAGLGSPISQHLQLRTGPGLLTNSRAIFSHFINVKPFDAVHCGPHGASPWHEGTLHHFCDGGWVWVIPFDNHSESTNPLCSVGLSLDRDRYPRDPALSPEREFAAFLERFPSIERQFTSARAVRPFMSADPLQYHSRALASRRWVLTAHAAGAVDALYSRGLLNSFQALDPLTEILFQRLADDRAELESFQPVAALMDDMLAVHDELVFGTYQSTGDPELLEMWLVLWSLLERSSSDLIALLEPDQSQLATATRLPVVFTPEVRELLRNCMRAMRDTSDGMENEPSRKPIIAQLLASFSKRPVYLAPRIEVSGADQNHLIRFLASYRYTRTSQTPWQLDSTAQSDNTYALTIRGADDAVELEVDTEVMDVLRWIGSTEAAFSVAEVHAVASDQRPEILFALLELIREMGLVLMHP
jgi:FADH2 O2-dependent halogenase